MDASFKLSKDCPDLFIEYSSDIIFCSGRGGRLVYVNPEWERRLGYDKYETASMGVADIVHPDFLQKCLGLPDRRNKGKACNAGDDPVEVVLVTKNKGRISVEIECCHIPEEDGSKYIAVFFCKDISHKKAAEEMGSFLAASIGQSDSMIAFKNIDFRVMAANDSYAKLSGHKSSRDIIGKIGREIFEPSCETFPAEFYFEMDKRAQNLLPGGCIEAEIEIGAALSERKKKLFVKKYPVFDAYGKIIGTGETARDITELKETKKTLKEREGNYSHLIDRMLHGFALHEIICDKDGRPVDYRFLSVNKRFEEQTGLRASEIIGRTVLDVLPDIEPFWIKKYGRVALTGEPAQFDDYSEHFKKWYRISSFSPEHGQFVALIDDITIRKKLEAALFLEKDRLEKTLLSVVEGVISTDASGHIKLMNTAAERITGWKNEDAADMPVGDVYVIRDENTRQILPNYFESVLQDGRQIVGSNYKLLISRDGNEIHIDDSAAPIIDSSGNIIGMILVFKDNTEMIEKMKLVEYLSLHDSMTGFYNRKYMEDSIKRLDTPRNLPFSVIYSDINGLKLVNDTLGHERGDALIISVANSIKSTLRSDDIVGRMGGDEFILLLPKTTAHDAENVSARINKAVSEAKLDTVVPSVALGFATKTEKNEDIYEIIRKAEASMYRNKLDSGKIMRDGTIENLVAHIGGKYASLRQHPHRVAEYCGKLAIELGLSDKESSDLRKTALLHDIGMIAVPAALLDKADEISAEEYELIKLHPEKGWHILRSVDDEYAALAESVLQHHERWDGSGYPRGLKEDGVLRSSRIIGVVDAYVSMTSDRPYRKAISKDEAVEELKRCSGRQFDPEITAIFIEKVLLPEK